MLASTSSQTSRAAEVPKLHPIKAKVQRLTPNAAMSALPIRVAQASETIDGHRTHVVTQHYADRILVIVTQVGKIGALVRSAFVGSEEGNVLLKVLHG